MANEKIMQRNLYVPPTKICRQTFLPATGISNTGQRNSAIESKLPMQFSTSKQQFLIVPNTCKQSIWMSKKQR